MKVHSFALIMLLLAGAVSCAQSPTATTAPSLQDAEWDFYWNQKIEPSLFVDNVAPVTSTRIKPPVLWTDPGPDGKRNPSFGFATYHIAIPVEAGKTIGVYVRDVFSAYDLYADNGLVLANGVFGTDEKTHEPAFVTRTAYFTPGANILHLTMHVSNFTNRDAGIAWIAVGTESDIARMRGFAVAFDAFLIGGLFIFAIYHLVLFLLRRKEWNLLYFSLLCIVVAFRVALMGERLASHLFSGINQNLLLQIEFLTVPLITIFFSAFFYRQYKISWYRFFHYPGVISSALFAASLFILPISVSNSVLSIYHLIAAFLGLGFITALIYAITRKMEGAVFFMAGFLVFFATVINDILLYNRIINSIYMIPTGIFLFLFSQAFILSFSFTRAFRSVDTLSRKLITLDKLKDAFLANTSNELVSPIGTMIGSAESILEGQAGKVNEEQARKLSFIVSSGRRLSNLVHDIMDFSQIKHKELVLEKKTLDMHQICQTVFLFSRPLLRDKEIELVNKIPESFPPVFGDARRIQQIMNNLIDNAIKFTDAGTITVSAFKMNNEGFFAVEDTGRGIPDDKLDIIFESFGQVNPKIDTQLGGKGLGLPITKYLIELHGGEITVNSTLRRGSTFTFSLPLASLADAGIPVRPHEEELMEGVSEPTPLSTEDQHTARVRPKAPASKIRILLACGDGHERRHIHELLESGHAAGAMAPSSRETFVISDAVTGEETLAQAAAGEFDLALVDLAWAKDEHAGFELCSKMRRIKTRQELPVIIMAKHRTDTNLVRGIEAGANDFIEKPLVQSELVMRVKTHSDLAKLQAAYARFVPERFLELLGKESIADVSPGDQIQKEMTILFCDIRAFMSFSEKMTPKETFTFLNSYYGKITPIIRHNRGFIDKYIGDEVMALFPENGEDALKAALEIKKSIDVYNMFRAKTGYEPVTIGIGIHSGPMMLGTIGDHKRLDGTVISDAVNTASRLEGLTKLYGGSIVISASIFYALQDPSQYFYRFLGLVQVKGRRSTVPIYEIYDDSEEGKRKQATKDDFEKALQLYFRKDFKEASTLFRQILEKNQSDKAARLFANRCEEYKYKVIDSDWDGVETVFTK